MKITAGSTSRMIPFNAKDASSTSSAGLALATNTAGLKAWYLREGGSETQITLAGGMSTSSWVSGGLLQPTTNQAGFTLLGVPNAALAAGAKWVSVYLSGAANLVCDPFLVELDAIDYQDGTRAGLAALPNANAAANGGLPTVDANNAVKVQNGTNANQLNLSGGNVTLATVVTGDGKTIVSGGTNGNQISLSGGAVLLQSGTATGQVSLSAGNVTLATASTGDGKTLLTSGTNANQLNTSAGAIYLQNGTNAGQIILTAGQVTTSNPATGGSSLTAADVWAYTNRTTGLSDQAYNYIAQIHFNNPGGDVKFISARTGSTNGTGSITSPFLGPLQVTTNNTTAGDIMMVGYGYDYDLANAGIPWMLGRSWVGADRRMVRFKSTLDEQTQGAIFVPPSNGYVEGITVYGYNSASGYSAPFGTVNPLQPIPNNFTIRKSGGDSDTGADVVLIQVKLTGATATCHFDLDDFHANAQFDWFNVFSNGNLDWPDLQYEINNSVGQSVCPAGSWDQTRGVVAAAGSGVVRNSTIVARSVSATQAFTYPINVRPGNPTNNVSLILDNVTLVRSSVAGSSVDLLVGNTSTSQTSGATVWVAGSRYLTTAGGPVTVIPNPATVTAGVNLDKSGYALTAAYDLAKTAAQPGSQMDLVNAPNATALTVAGTAVWATTTRALTDKSNFNLAADQSAVTIGTVNTLANGALTAIAAAVEGHLIDEADGQQLLTAIVAKINSTDVNLAGLSTATIAAAVWSYLQSNAVTANSMGTAVTGIVTSLATLSTTIGGPAGASLAADVAAVKADTGTLLTRIPAALFSGISSLAKWLRALARKDVPDATALSEINGGGGTFDPTTDALQAVRDRGDVAWLTGAGGGGGSGLTGPSGVTLTFVDAGGVAVPLVQFTIVGQGPGRADTQGVATFGLVDGTYTVAAQITDGVVFADTTLTVAGTTAHTITGSSQILSPPSAPNTERVTCNCITPSGAPNPGAIVEFRVIKTNGATGRFIPGTWEQSQQADVNGQTTVDLVVGYTYQFRTENGSTQEYTPPSTGAATLPFDVIGKANA